MTDAAAAWSFDPAVVDVDGDMTLVLSRRRGTKLEGGKIEFANDATDALRAMVRATVARLGSLERRTYEPSLAIQEHEYLAVPDQLIERAAPPLRRRARKRVEEKQAGAGKARTPPVEHIETDPQVRALLRNASGLPLLPAGELTAKPFLFYALVVGDNPDSRVSFVRKSNPVRTLGRGPWFLYGQRLTKVEEPLLGLDDHFDLVVTSEGVAVLSQAVFDALFRDAATLVERYPIWAKAFSTLKLDDEQTQHLVERCRSDSRLAARLRQIHESGHLAAGKVSIDAVLVEADRVAGGRDRFLKDGRLDFDGADVSSLLKLLNDDLFVGGLSKQVYEAGSKARF